MPKIYAYSLGVGRGSKFPSDIGSIPLIHNDDEAFGGGYVTKWLTKSFQGLMLPISMKLPFLSFCDQNKKLDLL